LRIYEDAKDFIENTIKLDSITSGTSSNPTGGDILNFQGKLIKDKIGDTSNYNRSDELKKTNFPHTINGFTARWVNDNSLFFFIYEIVGFIEKIKKDELFNSLRNDQFFNDPDSSHYLTSAQITELEKVYDRIVNCTYCWDVSGKKNGGPALKNKGKALFTSRKF